MAAWRSSFNFSFTSSTTSATHSIARRLLRASHSRRTSPYGFIVRVELDEIEAAPQRKIDQRYRTVGGVHRPDDVQVVRQREFVFISLLVLEADFLIAVLQQEVEFPEYLGEVAPVDLVDDEEVVSIRLLPCALRSPQ